MVFERIFTSFTLFLFLIWSGNVLAEGCGDFFGYKIELFEGDRHTNQLEKYIAEVRRKLNEEDTQFPIKGASIIRRSSLAPDHALNQWERLAGTNAATMTTDRGLKSYIYNLHFQFRESLTRLPPGSKILDVGAGMSNLAKDWSTLKELSLVEIGMYRSSIWNLPELSHRATITPLDVSWIGVPEIELGSLQSPTRITSDIVSYADNNPASQDMTIDNYAASVYIPIDLAILSETTVTKVGGRVFINLNNSVIFDSEGVKLTNTEFLELCFGFDYLGNDSYNSNISELYANRFMLIPNGQLIQVPALDVLMSYLPVDSTNPESREGVRTIYQISNRPNLTSKDLKKVTPLVWP